METSKTGYQVQSYDVPVKRYCQTLGTRLFMIVETPLDFDWDKAMERLNTLPRQQEWEEYMAIFQQAAPGMSSAEKWKPMERMFHLYNT